MCFRHISITATEITNTFGADSSVSLKNNQRDFSFQINWSTSRWNRRLRRRTAAVKPMFSRTNQPAVFFNPNYFDNKEHETITLLKSSVDVLDPSITKRPLSQPWGGFSHARKLKKWKGSSLLKKFATLWHLSNFRFIISIAENAHWLWISDHLH